MVFESGFSLVAHSITLNYQSLANTIQVSLLLGHYIFNLLFAFLEFILSLDPAWNHLAFGSTSFSSYFTTKILKYKISASKAPNFNPKQCLGELKWRTTVRTWG